MPLALKFDTVGPLCRSVEDAALLTAALEGSKAPDLRGASLKGRRFAIVDTAMMEDLRDAPKSAFARAVAKLEAAGAIVETIEVPAVQDALDVVGLSYDCRGLWPLGGRDRRQRLKRCIRKSCSGSVWVANTLALIMWRAWAKLEAARMAYDAATAGYDAVLAPTAPILPPNLERLKTDEDYYVTENLLALRNTRIGNLLGLCGLTIPTDTPSCGLMMLAAPDLDSAVLRLGAAAEAALA